MVEILALALHYDEQAVLAEVDLALEDGFLQNPYPEPSPQPDEWQNTRPSRRASAAGHGVA